MLSTEALGDLAGSMPGGVVITDFDRIDKYRMDRAFDPTAGIPAAVVRAESTEHVQLTIRWAGRHGVSVTTRGAGTGLSGGSTACTDGVVLSTERMRSLHVDPTTRTAVVGPGLLNAEVKAAASALGLWYPPDPSSFQICSIGGNVATNAGGLCCVKYGVTSDYVLGMQVVLADGTAIRLGGPRLKDCAGLSLTKLMVGSEGILGVITEVTLRLLPAQAVPATAVATFATDADATGAVLAITSALRPAMLEYMDSVAVNAVEDMLRMGLDRDAAALLIAQTDAEGPARERELSAIVAAFEKYGATEVAATEDAQEGDAFVVARRSAIPAAERRGKLLLEDVGVPLPRLPELVDGVHRIGATREVEIALIAHAGDGNTHPLLIFDPADVAATARAEAAFGEIMDLAITLGGTITGEHGVGRLKRPWLGDQIGPDALELTRRIKLAFDPHGILNPGVIL
ncbi:MAG TPA: FAD-linked oxidase C-terminal domain-containing protein [Sporichthyaceae bacterium]|nr:FAD-linked oxidase C-terminal domain-containing protein [Sporichthyaceae bacterium]